MIDASGRPPIIAVNDNAHNQMLLIWQAIEGGQLSPRVDLRESIAHGNILGVPTATALGRPKYRRMSNFSCSAGMWHCGFAPPPNADLRVLGESLIQRAV